MLNWPGKTSGELLDYAINWASALGTDTISTSTWSLSSSDLVNNHDTHTPSTATIWLASGTTNQTYVCTNTITTAAGRIFEQSVSIKIQSN